MAKRNKRNRNPRVEGTITSIYSANLFTVDEDKEVRVGPKTRFSGVAVNSTGLIIGQQVKAVGHKNKHKDFVADKINVAGATDPVPEEPVDPDDEEENPPVEPTPEPQPEPEPEPEPEDNEPAPEPEPEDDQPSDENASEEDNA